MDYIHIGKIVATFGTQGEVILTHALAKKLAFAKGSVVFVEQTKSSYIPYFILQSKAKNNEETIALFEGMESKEKAKILISKPVWLIDQDFRKLAGTTSPISLLGFALFNDDEPIGTVEEVIEQPHQVLLKITYKTKEALIPLHAETLISIDRKEKKVMVSLPDGLLEIYA